MQRSLHMFSLSTLAESHNQLFKLLCCYNTDCLMSAQQHETLSKDTCIVASCTSTIYLLMLCSFALSTVKSVLTLYTFI